MSFKVCVEPGHVNMFCMRLLAKKVLEIYQRSQGFLQDFLPLNQTFSIWRKVASNLHSQKSQREHSLFEIKGLNDWPPPWAKFSIAKKQSQVEMLNLKDFKEHKLSSNTIEQKCIHFTCIFQRRHCFKRELHESVSTKNRNSTKSPLWRTVKMFCKKK